MKKIIILFAVSLLIISCERKTETLGPDLSDIYGPFTVFEEFDVSKNTVDFSTGESINFSARFSKTVDWEVKIIGQTSGATKILTGKTKVLDETTARWKGSTTELPMFKTEKCNAYIIIEDEGYADTILNITINGTKVNDGFNVADFENGINPDWKIFKQSGANMSFFTVQSDTAAQADHYYDMGGEVTFDYLIGYIYFPADAYVDSATNLPYERFPLSSNPGDVFFNVLLNVPEGINNEIVLFQLTEDDNEDGIFQESSEDMYSIELKHGGDAGLQAGWQTISVRYSDLTALVNGAPATPNGNGIKEPHKLMEVRTLFLADPSSGYSQTFMDYMIFTENGPLEP